MNERTSMTVGEVAEATGVSIRTLHHYDEIGLVIAARAENGYRIYDRAALEILRHVLAYAELGFSLDEIHRIITDRSFDRTAALEEQRDRLFEKLAATEALVVVIEQLLANEGDNMTIDDLFDGFRPSEYAQEAEERWGGTNEWKIHQQRTSQYTKQDWERVTAESTEIAERFGALLAGGVQSDSDSATALAEEHRVHIDTWFYPCSREMHTNLGEMYVADPRFASYWNTHGEGLAEYVRDAIVANALK